MKKLIACAVFVLIFSNSAFAYLSQQAAIDNFLAGKKLESIEGIWLDSDGVVEVFTLSANEVKNLVEKQEVTLIDVRDIRELWREGTIENSKHIPRGMLEFWLDPESNYYQESKIKNFKKIVLFCAAGFRSALATKSLVEMGFKNVANASGGFDALKKAGLKVVTKEKK